MGKLYGHYSHAKHRKEYSMQRVGGRMDFEGGRKTYI